MATTVKAKTKFIEKKTTKVWNTSDHPDTDVESQNIMVMGKQVLPGAAIKVPVERMQNPKKLQHMVSLGMAHIGDQPPDDYVAAKSIVRVKLPAGVQRSHGDATRTAPVSIQELALFADPQPDLD